VQRSTYRRLRDPDELQAATGLQDPDELRDRDELPDPDKLRDPDVKMTWPAVALRARGYCPTGRTGQMPEACRAAEPAHTLAILTTVLLACWSGERQSARSDIAGVIPVGDVRIVGSTDSIARIADLAQAADGTVWILNTVEPYFIAMTIDGTIKSVWGKQGGGPGELRSPVGLVTDRRTGDVWAYDRGHRAMLRVSGFSGDPELIVLDRQRGAPNQPVSFEDAAPGGGRPWLRGGPNGFLMGRATGAIRLSLWHVDVIELESDGSIEPIFSLVDKLADPTSKYGDANEFLPFPMWDFCADGSVVIYDPVINNLRRFSAAGEEQQIHALPPERQLELTHDRLFGMAYRTIRENSPAGALPDSAQVYQQLERELAVSMAVASKYFPEYADFWCVRGNDLWLQRFDPDAGVMGRGATWLRVAMNGAVDSIVMPERFRPMRFDPDRVWGISSDDFGVESVAWIRYPEH